MEIDLKSIIVLLATQAMINMGEIKDPFTDSSKMDLQGAEVFIRLIKVLETKTAGNLTAVEESFLKDIQDNLDVVFKKKMKSGK